MFIAHLPAGYLLSKGVVAMEHLRHLSEQTKRRLIVAGMVGAISPDIDLLYFYLIDHRQHGHHSYWTHLPVFWVIAILIWIALLWRRSRTWVWLGIVFGLSALGHMVLDSTAGGIRWLYPLSMQYFRLAHIHAGQSWWVMNFVLHWTVLLEIVIVASAGMMYLRSKRAGCAVRTDQQ
ncbi:MAG: metal-dependent hydrolase [Burkholderiales bacterium]|nr:metal-dependent hydrolase [Burkholderiales bacterium]